MGSFVLLERLLWLHDQTRRGLFPNAHRLAVQFEIDPRTAKRTIAFLRDRLRAPLEYDPARRGYRYLDPGFHLPFLSPTQEEILAILMARKLLSPAAGGAISRAIQEFSRKLFGFTSSFGLSMERIEGSFSASWPGYAPAEPAIFHRVLTSLLENRLLRFSYRSPLEPEHVERTVEPHHFHHYLGSWVLTAWCLDRQDWRKFFLSRMSAPQVLEQRFASRSPEQWSRLVDESFGLFQGSERTEAVLRFSSFRARWIREQEWHPDQAMTDLPDGGLELRLPVADLREIKLKVLQFGADVEVLAPEELRREVVEEIGRMGRLYGAQTG